MPVFPRSLGAPGNQISKAAANLPETTTSTLFTVSGLVLIQFIAGLVTTAIQNQACNLSLGNTPAGGSAANTSLATAAAITNKSAGTLYLPTFTSGVGAAPVIAQAEQAQAGSGED